MNIDSNNSYEYEDDFFVQSEYLLYMQHFYFGGSNRLIGEKTTKKKPTTSIHSVHKYTVTEGITVSLVIPSY